MRIDQIRGYDSHILESMPKDSKPLTTTWRTAGGDLSDDEWDLISDLIPTYSGDGRMGRPTVHDKRDVVNAILYVASTGCRWRALPPHYPHWNTVHRYHVGWSRDGTWERIADRLRTLVRVNEGRDPDPSIGIIDARTVRGAATVTRPTRGYDAGKKVSGRKTFGVVDSLGLLLGIVVVAASVSDNTGGIAAMTRANPKSRRLVKLFSDGGFKTTFKKWCHANYISAEVVNRIHAHRFEVLPKRWIVERTWSWLMNSRRLQIDYERDPIVTEGFIWAVHSRQLLRRLTHHPT